MKKLFIGVICILICLSGCGSNENKPHKMSPEAYRIGTEALTIINQYNSGELSSKEMEKGLLEAFNQLDDENKKIEGTDKIEYLWRQYYLERSIALFIYIYGEPDSELTSLQGRWPEEVRLPSYETAEAWMEVFENPGQILESDIRAVLNK